MAKDASLCLFLFISSLIICCSGFSYGATFLKKNKISQSQIRFFVTDHKIWSTLYSNSDLRMIHLRRTLQDVTNSPTTGGFPTNPASSSSATPAIITVPSTTPVTVSPTNPAAATTTPVTVPSTTPPVPLAPTNPANSPVPVTNPGSQPVTAYPPPSSGSVPVTVPVTNPQAQPPPATTNGPANTGQSWCVAKAGVSQTTLQTALDYACGTGTADCSQIQQGGSCYNPNSLQNHASFAFNSYYQKNPAPTSCDFGGVATIVNTNPSTGTCIFPSSSGGGGGTSSSGSGTGTSPSGFGPQSPPDLDSSHSIGMKPFLGCMVLVISLVCGRLSLSS